MPRKSPKKRSLSRKERAEKRKDLTIKRAAAGLGDLVLVSKEKGTTKTLRSRTRPHATGLPEVTVTEKKKGKRKRVIARGASTRRHF